MSEILNKLPWQASVSLVAGLMGLFYNLYLFVRLLSISGAHARAEESMAFGISAVYILIPSFLAAIIFTFLAKPYRPVCFLVALSHVLFFAVYPLANLIRPGVR